MPAYTVRYTTWPLGGWEYRVTRTENYIPVKTFHYADEPWRAERDALQCAEAMNRREREAGQC